MAIDSFDGDYEFLSNFYPAKVKDGYGIEYPSVENAYQASKTVNGSLRVPFTTVTAGESKRMGRKLPLRKDWEQVKDRIMYDLLKQKFSDPALKTLLVQTGEEELIEGNWWNDQYWGVCHGVGKNMLGQLLMKIRAEITQGQAP